MTETRAECAIAERCGGCALITVPYLDEDIHDLAGIEVMDDYLFASEAVAQTGAE